MSFSHAFDISRNLQHGVTCLKRAGLPLFVGAFLMQCTEGGGGGGGSFPDPSVFEDLGGGSGSGSDDPDLFLGPLLQSGDLLSDLGLGAGEMGILGITLGLIIGAVIVGVLCGLVMFAFRSWLHGGYLRLHAHTLETGFGDFPALFSGSDIFLSMMLGKFLKGLILFGVTLAAAVPGAALFVPGVLRESLPLMIGGGAIFFVFLIPLSIYFGLSLAFVEHAIAFDNLPATQAISRSFDLAQGNRLHLFLFLLVRSLVILAAAVIGVMMLCVGLIFTIPLARAVTDVAFTEGYLLLTRPTAETERWTIWDPEPAR